MQTEHPDFRPIQQETVNACRIVIKTSFKASTLQIPDNGRFVTSTGNIPTLLSNCHARIRRPMLISNGASRFSLTKRRLTGLA